LIDSYGQNTATESLKAHVHKEPVAIEAPESMSRRGLEKKKRVPSSAANKPISLRSKGDRGGGKNEIFLDLLERLTVLFGSNGRLGLHVYK
jgi:AP-4 complex subunit mu-1